MIRFALPCLALILAACGGPSGSPEQQARAAEARSLNKAVWQTRAPVTVDGMAVDVAVAPDKSFALVDVTDFGETVTLPQAEKAASIASGCQGKDTSILSMLSGDKATPIKTSVFRKMDYLRIDLTCA